MDTAPAEVNMNRPKRTIFASFALTLAVAFQATFFGATNAQSAENNIRNFKLTDISSTEIEITLDYHYAGGFGTQDVFIHATPEEAGGVFHPQNVEFDEAPVQLGDNTAKLRVKKRFDSQDFTSVQIRVCMSTLTDAILCKNFPHTKRWSTTDASIPPDVSPPLPRAAKLARERLAERIAPAQEEMRKRPVVQTERVEELSRGPRAEGVVERTIRPDGTVEIRYADGTVKRLFEGSYEITRPDGTTSKATYVQSQPPTAPALPGDVRLVTWLEIHNDALLNVIRSLVTSDEAIDDYLQYERERGARSLYDKIGRRTLTIAKLLTP
jgi:hypothetical protein